MSTDDQMGMGPGAPPGVAQDAAITRPQAVLPAAPATSGPAGSGSAAAMGTSSGMFRALVSGGSSPGMPMSPMIGRDAELAQLDSTFLRAVDYQAPQLVTVVGAQGVGKSRLVADWLGRMLGRQPAGTPGRPRVYRGRAVANAGSYAIVQRLLRDRFAILESDDDATRLEKVRVQVTDVFQDQRMTEVMHFLGRFLELKIADNAFLRAVSAGDETGHQEAIARTVLRRFLELDAERSPLILAFDDLHLADDHSLALLRELAEGLVGSPVMLIAAGRPELFVRQPNWGEGNVDHSRIDLGPLELKDAERLLRALLVRAEPIPQALIEDASELTSGNPSSSRS